MPGGVEIVEEKEPDPNVPGLAPQEGQRASGNRGLRAFRGGK